MYIFLNGGLAFCCCCFVVFWQSLREIHGPKSLQSLLKMNKSNEIQVNSAGMRRTKHLYPVGSELLGVPLVYSASIVALALKSTLQIWGASLGLLLRIR